MGKASLPPGFRFHPTDIELIMYYLKRKVMGRKLHFEAISEVNIYKFSPWDLPDMSCLKSKDLEWFFFCPREKKYASGTRVKRATENGYWKTTGKDRPISYNTEVVGTVKTLVFHLGNAPQGERTDWVIHEYKILDKNLAAAGLQDTFVLCKVFKKSGPGPKNGAQYGAPFIEADWSDDDIVGAENNVTSFASGIPKSGVLPEKQCSNTTTILFDHGNTADLPSLEPRFLSSSSGRLPDNTHLDENDDDIIRMLSQFSDEPTCFAHGGINQGDLAFKGKKQFEPSDVFNIYDGLGDLDECPPSLNEGHFDLSCWYHNDYSMNMLFPDDSAYIELDDLIKPLNQPAEVIAPSHSSADETLRCNRCEQFHQGSPNQCTFEASSDDGLQ